jgi:hypothetical protein
MIRGMNQEDAIITMAEHELNPGAAGAPWIAKNIGIKVGEVKRLIGELAMGVNPAFVAPKYSVSSS